MGPVQRAIFNHSVFYRTLRQKGIGREKAIRFTELPIDELILYRSSAIFSRFLVYDPADFHKVTIGIEGDGMPEVGMVRCLEWDVEARLDNLTAHPDGPNTVELDVLRKGYIGCASASHKELQNFQPTVMQAGPLGLAGIPYIGFYVKTGETIGWVNMRAKPEEKKALERILR